MHTKRCRLASGHHYEHLAGRVEGKRTAGLALWPEQAYSCTVSVCVIHAGPNGWESTISVYVRKKKEDRNLLRLEVPSDARCEVHIGWCPAASSGRRGEWDHVDASEDGAAGGEAKVVAEVTRTWQRRRCLTRSSMVLPAFKAGRVISETAGRRRKDESLRLIWPREFWTPETETLNLGLEESQGRKRVLPPGEKERLWTYESAGGRRSRRWRGEKGKKSMLRGRESRCRKARRETNEACMCWQEEGCYDARTLRLQLHFMLYMFIFR